MKDLSSSSRQSKFPSLKTPSNSRKQNYDHQESNLPSSAIATTLQKRLQISTAHFAKTRFHHLHDRNHPFSATAGITTSTASDAAAAADPPNSDLAADIMAASRNGPFLAFRHQHFHGLGVGDGARRPISVQPD